MIRLIREYIFSFNAQMESLGPDGRPGYDHVVRLANSLVDLRHEGFITQHKVVEIQTLWDKLSEFDKGALVYPARHCDRLVKGRFKVSHSVTNVTPGVDSLKHCFLDEGSGPAQWPNTSRLVEAICLVLCCVYPAGQTVAGVRVNRCRCILQDYRMIRDVVLDSPRLMAKTRLQLFDLNQHITAVSIILQAVVRDNLSAASAQTAIKKQSFQLKWQRNFLLRRNCDTSNHQLVLSESTLWFGQYWGKPLNGVQ